MAYLDSFDSKQLRDVLGTFTTGVTVVTTRDANGVDHGVTANSFSSVSLDPPLILWSQAYTSKSLPAFRESRHFAVNILADNQVAVSNRFAKSSDDKFTEIEFFRGIGDVPVLRGTVAHFECVKEAAYPAGDHLIFIGRVERVAHSGRRPLAFAHGQYMVPYAHGLGPVGLRQGHRPHLADDALENAAAALPGISNALGDYVITLAVWGNYGPVILRAVGHPRVDEDAQPGTVLSVTQTASGRAFAAFLATEITKSLIKEDLRLHRVADEDQAAQVDAFAHEIYEAQKYGLARGLVTFAASAETLNAFSAPVFDAAGQMIFSLCVSGNAKSLSTDTNGSVPQALLRYANLLSKRVAT